jgi:hypothetical protein
MRCRMSSAMGSVGPPASMKRGVMGGASALAPPARRLCPAPAPAHGTHSSLCADSGVRPARGNNTRLRDAGRHRAWRVREGEQRSENLQGGAHSARRPRTARTRATPGAPTQRLDIALAEGSKWRLPAWHRGRAYAQPLWRSPRLSRSSRPATSQPPRRRPCRCVSVLSEDGAQGARRGFPTGRPPSVARVTNPRVRGPPTPHLTLPLAHTGSC